MNIISFDGTDDVSITAGRSLLYGFSIHANSNSRVNIRNGGASGSIIFPIYIPSGSTSQFSIDGGLVMEEGIYFDVVSGNVTGSIWTDI